VQISHRRRLWPSSQQSEVLRLTRTLRPSPNGRDHSLGDRVRRLGAELIRNRLPLQRDLPVHSCCGVHLARRPFAVSSMPAP